jgi:hypothetical protein
MRLVTLVSLVSVLLSAAPGWCGHYEFTAVPVTLEAGHPGKVVITDLGYSTPRSYYLDDLSFDSTNSPYSFVCGTLQYTFKEKISYQWVPDANEPPEPRELRVWANGYAQLSLTSSSADLDGSGSAAVGIAGDSTTVNRTWTHPSGSSSDVNQTEGYAIVKVFTINAASGETADFTCSMSLNTGTTSALSGHLSVEQSLEEDLDYAANSESVTTGNTYRKGTTNPPIASDQAITLYTATFTGTGYEIDVLYTYSAPTKTSNASDRIGAFASGSVEWPVPGKRGNESRVIVGSG